MAFLIILFSLQFLIFTIAYFYNFFLNLHLAKATGLPYVCVPFHELGLIVRYSRTLRARFIPKLPFGRSKVFLVEYLNQHWRWNSKNYWHERFGDIFITVSPGGNTINVAEPTLAKNILSNRSTFVKPVYLYSILELYGPSVLTTEGSDWSFHRRITSPSFKAVDSLLSQVWQESQRLTTELLQKRVDASAIITPMRNVRQDFGDLTLYVISSAGFGVPLSFQPNLASSRLDSSKGHRLTYPQSLQLLTDHLQKIAFFPRWLLRAAPRKSWRMTSHAADEFGMYIEELLDANRTRNVEKPSIPGTASNLLEALLNSATELEGPEYVGNKRVTKGLVQQEITGNAFAFALAGHETTAGCLHMCLLLLAIFQDKQDWLLQQLDEATTEVDHDGNSSYSHFKSLSAFLCVMYETLRIFPPVPALPKSNGNKSLPMIIGGRHFMLPPHTSFMVSVAALHNNSRYWGPCVDGFFPEQWHIPSTPEGLWNMQSSSTIGAQTPFSEIRRPDPGVYLPFSSGGRSCLGKDFAEVEIVAVLAKILEEYRVDVEPLSDRESFEQARARAWEGVGESVLYINLVVRGETPLRFVRRK